MSKISPSYSDSPATVEEWPVLREEIAATNLQRMWWLLLTSTCLSIFLAAFNFFGLKQDRFVPWQIFDIGGSLIFLFLIWRGRKGRLSSRARWWLSPAYFAFWLILMDGYYFNALLLYGETATYLLGMVTPSILILLPPRIFLSLLLPNHVVFCTLLLTLRGISGSVENIHASLINGTLGVLIAILAAGFLFRARKTNFHHERLILRQRQEARKAASNQRAILENMPFQAWLKDIHGRFLAVNREFAEAQGFTVEGILGKTAYDLYPRERADQYTREDEEIIRTGEKAYFEQSLLESRGLRWYEIFKNPAVDDKGGAAGIAGLARDITERKQIEQRLVAADRTKSEFLAAMSHEIRTPMNSVLGYAELLKPMLDSPEEREYVESIEESGRLLLTIINDILDFSKIEANGLVLQAQTIPLRALLARVMRMFESQAVTKNLGFELHIPDDVPEIVRGDAHRIEQVLSNLISNSLKFTETGSVEVRVTATAASENGWEIQFEIRDTGIGIAAEQMERLFKPFSQVDTAMARRFSGTGLGLVIAQKLCRLMGGDIAARSVPGEGSVFTATISALPPEPETAPQGGQAPTGNQQPDFSSRQVLVVEDNRANLRLVTAILSKWGVHPTAARSGEEAILAVHAKAFDTILMDVQMPGMDGLETTGKIRAWESQHPERKKSHIIALTAFAMKGDEERCFAAGMDSYLSKPLNVAALQRAMTQSENETPQDFSPEATGAA